MSTAHHRPQACAAGYIDAHCHLTAASFAAGLDANVRAWRERGIGAFILGGVSETEWAQQDELCRRWPGVVHPVWGLHPWTVAELDDDACEQQLNSLRLRLANRRPLALGETGLDHGRAKAGPERERQLSWLRAQLAIAREHDLPVVLHVVQAHAAALAELSSAKFRGLRYMVHGFRGDRSLVLRYARQGLTLSIGPNGAAKMNDEALRSIPSGQLVVESDAPYGATQQEGVEPTSLFATAERIARARGETKEQILDRSRANLLALFALETT